MRSVVARLRDVEFAYGHERSSAALALRGVTIEVHTGDRVGLVGASGSGKSTLLHVLAGLARPHRGTVERPGGEDRIPSLVFQFPERQLFAETVRQDVGYGLRESGVPRSEITPRVEAALADVGLPPGAFLERVPFHLSGGEMRRVALAGALAQRRQVLLLDEPTLGLDAEGLSRLREILERVHAAGVAYWMASHDADIVAATCDRLVVLDAGRVAFDGTPAEFWRAPERAAALGVQLPRSVALASRLRAAGFASLPDEPTEQDLVQALVAFPRRGEDGPRGAASLT